MEDIRELVQSVQTAKDNVDRTKKLIVVLVIALVVVVSIIVLLIPAPSVSAIPVSTSDTPITENISEAMENVGCLSSVMVLGGGLLGLMLMAKQDVNE